RNKWETLCHMLKNTAGQTVMKLLILIKNNSMLNLNVPARILLNSLRQGTQTDNFIAVLLSNRLFYVLIMGKILIKSIRLAIYKNRNNTRVSNDVTERHHKFNLLVSLVE